MGLFNNEENNTKSPIANFILGIVLFIGAFVLLFWNEGNYAKNITKEKFIRNNVIEITENRPENNGKLVHYIGNATTDEFIGDKDLKARVLVLDKKAQVYQWKEVRKSRGRHTRTSYYKVWSSKHYKNRRNIEEMPVKSARFEAEFIKIGTFILKPSVISYLQTNTTYSQLPQLNNGYKTTEKYYHTGDLSDPQIGDIRISYKYLPINSKISVIARQLGNSLEIQRTNAGDVALVENGEYSSNEMIEKFKKDNYNNVLTYRVLGLVLMCIGILCILEPISMLFSVIGLGWLFNFVSIIPAIIISVVLSGFTIAIAWLAYRPLISISILSILTIILITTHKNSTKRVDTKNADANNETIIQEPKDQLEKELNDLMK